MTNLYIYFFESNVVGVNRLFVLVYSNQSGNIKRFKARRYYFPKGVIENHNFIISEKNYYDQPIDSHTILGSKITGKVED